MTQLLSDRPLPCSPEAEQSVLGAILLDNNAWYSADGLSTELFSLDSNRRIFAVMAQMFEESNHVSIPTLISALRDAGELDAVGGLGYIAGLTDGVPARANLGSYQKILREKRDLRTLINSLNMAVQKAVSGIYKVHDISAEVQEQIFTLQSNTLRSEAKSFADVITTTLNEIHQLRKHEGEVIGLCSGIHDLDTTTTGIRPKELWIVGAYPGRGKTVLGIQFALECGVRNVPVAVFSLEMAASQLGMRSLSAEGGPPAFKIRSPKYLNVTELRDMEQLANQLMGYPIYVDDPSVLSAKELCARIRLYRRKYDIQLAVVDYIQLVDGPGREVREKVGRTTNMLRQVAKDEGLSIVALSQLSRPKSGDMNDAPSMAQLRESGEIEAHAHTILLLHIPEDREKRPTGEDVIWIAKQRNGPRGPISVRLDGSKLRFVQRTRPE